MLVKNKLYNEIAELHNQSLNRRHLLKAVLAGFGASVAGLSFESDSQAATEEPKLNFYNWDTYIGETTLPDFKKASAIQVKLSLFADNDELFAKLKEGNSGFDVVVPSGFCVARLIKGKLIQPLDFNKIPNFKKNIFPEFQNAEFDPGRKFSVPYMWATSGIGYRKNKVNTIPSWKEMFESDQYKGRIGLFNNSTTLRMVAKYLGYGMNPKDKAQIDKAADFLIKQKPNIKVFHDDNGQDLLLSGEVDLVQEWCGDMAQLQDENSGFGYVVPDMGSEITGDGLVIPKDAPHPNNAHKFINYILDADVGVKIIKTVKYASANQAAVAKMDANYRNNPTIFPPKAVLKNCEPVIYESEQIESYYADAWTRVQAA